MVFGLVMTEIHQTMMDVILLVKLKKAGNVAAAEHMGPHNGILAMKFAETVGI